MELYAIRTWFDAKDGVVLVEDDVQNVIRDIKAVSPRLHVFYNEQSGEFDVVEHCLDGAQRWVLSTPALDARILHRLHGADHWHGQDVPNHVLGDGEDVAAQVDAHNAQREAALDEDFRGRLIEPTERLMWALDNVKDRSSKGGSIRVPRSISG